MIDIMEIRSAVKEGLLELSEVDGNLLLEDLSTHEKINLTLLVDPSKDSSACGAKWVYWDGWASNHDLRIDDAECSKCGYKLNAVIRPTDGRSDTPNFLPDYCPGCGRKLNKCH